jgi:hypothetical protein
MATAATALVGLSSGFRAGMERNRRQRIEEEDRQIGLADLERQRRRQDAADTRAEEEHRVRMEERDYQAGLRETSRRQQEEDRARQARERQGRAIYNLARMADEGADPSSFIEMGGQDLPPGTTFDAATGEIVIAGPDGAQRRYSAKEVRAGLEPVFGAKKEVNDFTLGPGQVRYDASGKVIARGPPQAAGGDRHPPSGYQWKRDGSGLEPIPGGPADKGTTGPKPITPAEQRLRGNAFRSALDSRTKNQYGTGSTLDGKQKQQYGAIADRMIAKYGTAAPGADDLAQIILGHMSALPSLTDLTNAEVQRMKASGEAPKTGWFDGVSDADAARAVASETAKAQLAIAQQEVEALIERDVADIASAFYGYGADAAAPVAAGGAAAPSVSNAPAGVDGKPLW